MSYHSREWIIFSKDEAKARSLAEICGVSQRIACLLQERGIEEPEEALEFLSPKLSSLKNPLELKGMSEAVSRLMEAVEKGQNIVIWGDYDVDGVTSTTLLLKYFEAVGVDATFFVPNRFNDGYGLNKKHLERLHQEGADVVITVDCGISNFAEVAYANTLGLDIIIIDHHEVPAEIPAALAVIDPLQPDCQYGCTWMAAVGLTFHVLVALRAEMRSRGYFSNGAVEPDLRRYLDVTAVGTIADLAPLKGVNRVLTKVGINMLQQTYSPGLRALVDVCMAGRTRSIDSGFVGFQVGPRINAAGRLSDASQGVRMLTAGDYHDAYQIAVAVDEENVRRKEIQENMIEEAMAMMADRVSGGLQAGYVLWSTNWHAGVAGIVASRLVEEFYRPFIIVAVDEGQGKASARSISGFHMVQALESLKTHLQNFGGHAHAAGLSIAEEQLPDFAEAFAHLAEQRLSAPDLTPKLRVHGVLNFGEISGDLMQELSGLEPYGMANRKPVFFAEDVTVVSTRVVKGNHLQMRLSQDGYAFQSIAFGCGDREPETGSSLDVAFFPEWNEWRGRRSIQLQIKDFRSAGTSMSRDT